MATPRIHGFGDSHCACILTGYLLSDVNKVFYNVLYTCELPFKAPDLCC